MTPQLLRHSTSDLTTLTSHDPALHRQLVDRASHRLAGYGLVREAHLEHDPPRLHVGHPPLRRALTGTHAGFGRLLGQRTVGEDVDPNLPATLDVPGHGDTGGLDLPVGHVTVLERLDSEVTEVDLRATLGGAGTPRRMLLAVLDLAWDEHASALR